MGDASRTIYVGRVKVTASIAAYAVQTQSTGTWKDVFDTRRLAPPYTLFCRYTDVDTAVTCSTGIQAKLQHCCYRPEEEGIGVGDKAAAPATDMWKDAEESTTAIETTAMTTYGFESSNPLTEQLGDHARVLLVGVSADWQEGVYVDVWLKGNAR
jgi:hypothetical protein